MHERKCSSSLCSVCVLTPFSQVRATPTYGWSHTRTVDMILCFVQVPHEMIYGYTQGVETCHVIAL